MFFACGSAGSVMALRCACPSVGLLAVSRATTPAHTGVGLDTQATPLLAIDDSVALNLPCCRYLPRTETCASTLPHRILLHYHFQSVSHTQQISTTLNYWYMSQLFSSKNLSLTIGCGCCLVETLHIVDHRLVLRMRPILFTANALRGPSTHHCRQ